MVTYDRDNCLGCSYETNFRTAPLGVTAVVAVAVAGMVVCVVRAVPKVARKSTGSTYRLSNSYFILSLLNHAFKAAHSVFWLRQKRSMSHSEQLNSSA